MSDNNKTKLTCNNDKNNEVISLIVDNTFGTYNHDSLYNRDLPEQHPIEAISGLEDKLQELADNKLDKEDGKSLIDNTLIDKITDINFNEYVVDPNYVHTDNNFSSTYKNKLQNIEPNAQVNTVNSVNSKTGNIVIYKDDIGLSNVDNTSDINKPISNATKNELNKKANKDDLASVAITGEYNDLSNLPTNLSQFSNDLGYITKDSKDVLSNKTLNASNNTITNISFDNLNTDLVSNEISTTPSNTKLVTEKAVKDIVDTKFDSVNISKVGKTGLYKDLINTPDLTQYATNNTIEIINNQIDQLVKPTDLSAVAFSGKYNDLSGKPSIPTKMSQLEQDIEIVDPALLESFANKDEVNIALRNKQDKLTAGNNVEITRENIINVNVPQDIIPDETTIIKNEEDIITAVGIKTKSNTIKYDWEGTLEEWAVGRREGYIPDNWYCHITDDYESVVGPKGDAGTIEIGSVTSGDEVSVTNVGTDSTAILNFVLKQGDIGPSNVLSIGSVESGEVPSVNITGDSPNQVLNFVLPKGDTGEISIGKVSKGIEPSVTNSGTSTDAILNFVLPKGDTSTITVGNVSKGIEPSVTNVGTSNDAIFDFVLPKGDKGDTSTITVGNVSKGIEPSVINSGTTTDAILDFVLPKGDKGDTSTITVGNVESGSRPSVTNSGTANDAIFDFILPKGDKGDSGPSGTIESVGIFIIEPDGTPMVENVGTKENAELVFFIPQGPQGDIGPQGMQGEVGPSNVLSIGSVTKGDEASASITGYSPNQVLNLVLPKGDKGDVGPIKNISIESTKTGEAGTSASVWINDTDETSFLNFTIPRGEQGIQGEVGPQGIQGEVGPSNILSIGTVESGATPSASITGDSPNQVLNLVLPQGDIGPQGIQGEVGPSNILSIGTVTKGDEASVNITGDSPNQILNFVLPKGDKGDKGDRGDTGYGMPSGGLTGQILSKVDDTDYNVEWIDNNPATMDYNDLTNKPTSLSEFNNDVGYLTIDTLPVWDGGSI